ncbi:MAG TPA: ABC transporter permease [Chryseolinea sp.]|nr:ABC transporter permease [Chryseolinea sp.]
MNTPPKLLHWLLDECCPDSRPDLKGDLLELYDSRSLQAGRPYANRKLLQDAISIIPMHLVIKKETRKAVHMISNYLKIARRNLVKNKIYTAINVVSLAISTAVCILIALFIRDELSFDKHFTGGENVFRVAGNYSQGGVDRVMSAQTSYLVKPMIEHEVNGLEFITRVEFLGDLVTVDDKAYPESRMAFADSTFFDVFRASFLQGDAATALDRPENVVIGQRMAIKYFGTDDALGKFIELRGKQFVVTGVFEPFPQNTHFECPIVFPISGVKQWYADWVLTNASGTSLYTYLKLKDKVATENFELTATRLVKDRWGWEGESAPKYFLQPLTSIHLKSNLQGEVGVNGSMSTIYVFSLTGLVILILATINYINLTTAASFQRSKEVGMKKVLGSTTRMLVSQFQTESFVVALTSTILAMILAKLVMPAFNQLSGKALDFNPFADPWLAAALLALVILIGTLAGAAPAFVLLRTSTMGMLSDKLQWRSSKSYLRSGLIVFQFSISITLIACTLIVMDQIGFIRKTDLGIDPEAVVLIPFQTGDISARYEQMKTEMKRNPQVISVGASSNKVTERVGGWRGYKPDPSKKDGVSCASVAISDEFFETLKASMVEGRSFSKERPSDITTGYILNESAVKFFNLEHPIGNYLFGATFTGSTWYERNGEVIGVVKDFHFASLHEKVQPVVFYMASELTESLGWMEVRISGDNIPQTLAALEKVWTNVAGDRPFQYEFMDEAVALHYRAEDRFLKIFTTFSVLSIMLGGLGLFGLTAFMAKRRTKEIGIRRVMGASIPVLIRTLSSDFMKLVLIANIIGWPLAYFFMRDWLNNFAYQAPISLSVFVSTAVGVLAIAFMCVLYHSLKVSRVSPVKSLRSE